MRNRPLIVPGALLAIPGCRGEPTSPSGPADAPSPNMAVAAYGNHVNCDQLT
jgi:hypothetical protein